MRMSKIVLAVAGAAAASWAAVPAFAHHSFAMFDNDKVVTLEGIVKDYQWTNPHSWVQVLVKDPTTGMQVEWSIENGSPSMLSRVGWTRNSAKPGDKAVVVIHPLKSGSAGGSLLTLTINGEKVGGKRPDF
jgi:hypothetical protein